MRDLTEQQFKNKLNKYGITRALLGGYYCVKHDSKGREQCFVYAGNGGTKRRSQLAYLISEQKKAEQRNK